MAISCSVLLGHPLPLLIYGLDGKILWSSCCCQPFKPLKNVVESIHVVCDYALGTKTRLKYQKTLPTHYRNALGPMQMA